MPSAPFGHSAIRPIIGQLSHSIGNLSRGVVDKLPPLDVIPARRQPQMPVQHPGNQLGRYQLVVHAAIVRRHDSFRPNACAAPPSRVKESPKPPARSNSRHPISGPATHDSRLSTSRCRREPCLGSRWPSWVTAGLPVAAGFTSVAWDARRGARWVPGTADGARVSSRHRQSPPTMAPWAASATARCTASGAHLDAMRFSASSLHVSSLGSPIGDSSMAIIAASTSGRLRVAAFEAV